MTVNHGPLADAASPGRLHEVRLEGLHHVHPDDPSEKSRQHEAEGKTRKNQMTNGINEDVVAAHEQAVNRVQARARRWNWGERGAPSVRRQATQADSTRPPRHQGP